jgi:beta-glucosidase
MTPTEILKALTLDEKIRWTAGNNMWTMIGAPRLGIDPIVVADGPHGVRVYKEGPKNQALDQAELAPSTLFPTAAAMAATFHPELIQQVGAAIGAECNMYGVDVLLAPGVNLKRSPLGGRNFEYYSEDPYLTGRMATAFIQGVQSTGVGATIKHFALNEQEDQRRFVSTEIDERTMHEMYLEPFRMAIKEANPWAVMSSYNRIHGEYASESKDLLIDVLRTKWNYDGVVMSDWHAVQDKIKSIRNGLNVEMPGPSEFETELREALKRGDLSEADLDRSLEPLLYMREKVIVNPNKGSKADLDQHHDLANRVAKEAIVLLENDGILPLNGDPHLGVIGEFARHPRINGGGSATLRPYRQDTPLEFLKREWTISYAPGYDEERTNEDLLDEVDRTIESCDIVVLFTGTTASLETEGKDREHMDLPAGHLAVWERIRQSGKPVVVVLMNGSAVNVTPLIGSANAVLEQWFLGGASGQALVDILAGRVNPSGRLSETFPIRLEHTPHYGFFPSMDDVVDYHGDLIRNGYRYYDTHDYPVRYPFGYGLSYTTFEYKNLTLSSDRITDVDSLQVTIDITNTGSRAGQEVVQLYVEDVEHTLPRPKKELRRFKKMHLEAGESKRVTFTLEPRDFALYMPTTGTFEVEAGAFRIHIGPNVRDIALVETLTVDRTTPFPLHLTMGHPLKRFFQHRPNQAHQLDRFRTFPWYEIEEPAERVLRRLAKQFHLTEDEHDELVRLLLNEGEDTE